MSVPNEIQGLTRGVVDSFNSGIEAVGQLIEKGLELLDGYRREEEAVRGSLRESLASIGSLRRRDFDGLMEPVLQFQMRREQEIKALIKDFLSRQRELTQRLRRALEAGILQEVEKGKKELREMLGEAREEILSFQKEQETIRCTFARLESHKEGVTIKELKKEIQDLGEELLKGGDNHELCRRNGTTS